VSRQMRREGFDLAMLLTNSFRTALIAWAGGADRRVGFAREMRSWLLTDALTPKPRNQPHPAIDEYLRLAQYLGSPVPKSPAALKAARRMQLATSPAHEQRYARFLKRSGYSRNSTGIVCLNPGGAFGAAKHWPSSSFAELGRLIADRYDKLVVVLCGPAERGIAREIVHEANHPQVVGFSAEQLSLGLTKEAVRRADLLITTDSGPRHFAAPFEVPVVTLFGPTHIAWSETFYDKAVHLQLAVDCGPCQQRICPLGHHRCMRELRVDRVLQAAGKLIEQYPRRAVA